MGERSDNRDDASAMSLGELLADLRKQADGRNVKIGDLLDAFSHRAYGPLLVVPALVAISPIGAIPGLPLVMGVLVVVIAGQILFGVSQPWLPQRIKDIEFRRSRLERSLDFLEKPVAVLEKLIAPRLTLLTDPPFLQLIAAVCIALAISFGPLELIPFAVAVPGLAMLLLGVGLTTRDGALVAVGFAVAAGVAWLTFGYAL